VILTEQALHYPCFDEEGKLSDRGGPLFDRNSAFAAPTALAAVALLPPPCSV